MTPGVFFLKPSPALTSWQDGWWARGTRQNTRYGAMLQCGSTTWKSRGRVLIPVTPVVLPQTALSYQEDMGRRNSECSRARWTSHLHPSQSGTALVLLSRLLSTQVEKVFHCCMRRMENTRMSSTSATCTVLPISFFVLGSEPRAL